MEIEGFFSVSNDTFVQLIPNGDFVTCTLIHTGGGTPFLAMDRSKEGKMKDSKVVVGFADMAIMELFLNGYTPDDLAPPANMSVFDTSIAYNDTHAVLHYTVPIDNEDDEFAYLPRTRTMSMQLDRAQELSGFMLKVTHSLQTLPPVQLWMMKHQRHSLL